MFSSNSMTKTGTLRQLDEVQLKDRQDEVYSVFQEFYNTFVFTPYLLELKVNRETSS